MHAAVGGRLQTDGDEAVYGHRPTDLGVAPQYLRPPEKIVQAGVRSAQYGSPSRIQRPQLKMELKRRHYGMAENVVFVFILIIGHIHLASPRNTMVSIYSRNELILNIP